MYDKPYPKPETDVLKFLKNEINWMLDVASTRQWYGLAGLADVWAQNGLYSVVDPVKKHNVGTYSWSAGTIHFSDPLQVIDFAGTKEEVATYLYENLSQQPDIIKLMESNIAYNVLKYEKLMAA